MLALPLAKKLRTAGRVLREGGTAEAWALVTSNFQAAIHTLPGGLIRAGTQRFRASDAVTRERLLNGDYELPERFAVKRYLRPSTPVVELGASLGVVSCAINRRLSNPERHVAVEANPAVLPILTGNRDLNGCRFEIVHAAAGAEGDVITFYIGGDTLCSSAVAATGKSVDVPAVTLRSILESRQFDRCALVSDIEGAEINLVRAELPTFRKCVEVFIVEFHPAINGPGEVEAVRELLTENGFRFRWQQAEVQVFENSALLG